MEGLAEIATGCGVLDLVPRDEPVLKQQTFEGLLKVIEFSGAKNYKLSSMLVNSTALI